MTTTTARSPRLDTVCAAAIDLAREAAQDVGHAFVGPHLGAVAEEERVVTHFFDNLDPAYRGWRWAVTLVRPPRGRTPTVDEVCLLPGDGALLPPPWVPWSERLRPGDLGVGDLLPTPEDDERLTPAFLSTDDPDAQDVVFELWLGRARVLSYDGRTRIAHRWYTGDAGPEAPIARAAPANCATCGFFVPLAGALRQAFGVCANEYAPDDRTVVSVDHGCGAHSEAVVVPSISRSTAPVVDEFRYDVVVEEPHVVGEQAPGSVTDTDQTELLGHS